METPLHTPLDITAYSSIPYRTIRFDTKSLRFPVTLQSSLAVILTRFKPRHALPSPFLFEYTASSQLSTPPYFMTNRPVKHSRSNQMVGDLSDESESPTERPVVTPQSSASSLRATAAAATAQSSGLLSPRRLRLADESGERPASPISVVSVDVPSPLPRIVTEPIGAHFSSGATPLSGLMGLDGLETFVPGDSPGVESTREYSESDEDAPDTPGDLMGERLLP